MTEEYRWPGAGRRKKADAASTGAAPTGAVPMGAVPAGGAAFDMSGYDPTAAFPEDAPVFVISVAAQLAGMHPQTLRQYDRLGLVNPGRTPGGGRRYSARDVVMLREVGRLTQEEGINLAGVKRIIELTAHVAELQAQVRQLAHELELARQEAVATAAAVHASYRRDLVPVRPTSLVVWRPPPR